MDNLTYTYKNNNTSHIALSTYDYLDGFVYTTIGTGTRSLSYFATAEGRVMSNTTATAFTYEYFIKDNLGNTRVSFQDNGSGIAAITQENEYYPFGMTMQGIVVRTAQSTTANKQLYNGGSELQDDLGFEDSYCTPYREYDPQLGRFNAIDPAVDKYADWSPYNFAFNDPVGLNDPTGADPNGPPVDANGNPIVYGYNDEMSYQLRAQAKSYRLEWARLSSAEISWQLNLFSPNFFDSPMAQFLKESSQFYIKADADRAKIADQNNANRDYKFSYIQSTSTGEIKNFHLEFVEPKDASANQGGDKPLTHAQELAKYRQIVSFGNVSISGSYGAGVAYEYGTIETDKGWLQKYQTVYSVAGAGISGGSTGGAIIAIGNNKHTFSDWRGLAIGGSVSYLFFGATAAKTDTYYAIGASLGLGYGIKSNWNGTFSYAWTFLIGKPYRRPPVDLSRSYLNTQTYLGGQ